MDSFGVFTDVVQRDVDGKQAEQPVSMWVGVELSS